MVFSNYLKIFLVTTNNFISFLGYYLIYFLFESNTLAWKTQWNYLGVVGNFLRDVSVQTCYYLRICVPNKYIWHIHRISKNQWAISLLSSTEYICWNKREENWGFSQKEYFYQKKSHFSRKFSQVGTERIPSFAFLM